MNDIVKYAAVFILLIAAELSYFKIAAKYGIVDRPNSRSSHEGVVLRGGGVIFTIGMWLWAAFFGLQYPWFLLGLTAVAMVSFIDDIHPLPDRIRLAVQFFSAFVALIQIGAIHFSWQILLSLIGLVVFVGIMNVYNFMDGINGMTGGYSIAVLVPIFFINHETHVVDSSIIIVSILSVLTFCINNFRPKGKAKCFAGDVGSIGISYIILFVLSSIIISKRDVTYLVLLSVYGVDACLTIIHRILLHENLGTAHRKHAYQIMANELKIGHQQVSGLYFVIQMSVSLIFVFLIPDTSIARWSYFSAIVVILSVGYLLFMKKYYHLHVLL